MKDLGKMDYCLGIEVWRQEGKTLITQSKCAKKLIQRFNMQDCKVVCTQLEKNFKFCCMIIILQKSIRLCIVRW